MPFYYPKVTIKGVAGGQNIINILYFGDDAGDYFLTYPSAEIVDIGTTLDEALTEDWLGALPDEYSLVEYAISTVDERGVTNSPNDVIFPVNQAGVQGGTQAGVMLCAIVPFQTNVAPNGALNLKRSYIAYGPVNDTFVDDDQSLTASFAALMAPILITLGSTLVGSVGEYVPVRIGRTVNPAPTRVGVVSAISLRPYASVRRSRMKSPRGT